MSETPEGELPLPMPAGGGASAPLSLGTALKSLREARGLSLGDVSARIKYSASQLRHLESQEWDQLPSGVPLRGLVRNYARFLEADPEALLSLLDEAVGPTRPGPAVTAMPARRALQQAEVMPRGEPAHRTWAWLLAILVLIGILGWYAIDRGWIPEDWLIFDWLKALRP